MKFSPWACAAILTLAMSTGSCSFRGLAVETVGDMLSQGGSAFADEDDIELVGEALPFSLKLTDSLLEESPRHRGLLRAAAQGYVLYSYAYVQFPAEKIAGEDLDRARYLRARARKLYFRAFDYAVRGLELRHPGLGQAMLEDPGAALTPIDEEETDEVPFLYWAASALGLAISVSKNDPAMLARLGEVEAMLQRALELDDGYGQGVLHEFALVLVSASPHAYDREAIDRHYRRALELSHGNRASLYVNYAMAVPLRAQDREAFQALIAKALAVEPDAAKGQQLSNALAQRRARWLSGRMDELFLD
jgi:predicted anti-sigma-YlaC factor YlaD